MESTPSSNTKLKYILAITVIVCATAIYIFAFPHGKAEAPEAENQPATSTESPIMAGIDIVKKTEETAKYSIEYPQITVSSLATPAAAKRVNDQLKAEINRMVTEFKNETADAALLNADVKHTIQIGMEEGETVAGRVLAVKLIVSSYFSGAAHPLTVSNTMNFDVSTGKLITYADIFKPGSNYLERMSEHSKNVLKSKLAMDGVTFFEEGAEPTADNYATFLIGKDGLRIFFGQYQVAPYAAGEQEVTMSYIDLSDLLRGDSVLGEFAKGAN